MRRAARALLALAALAACGENAATLTYVAQAPRSQLPPPPLTADDASPLEVHGAPPDGASAAEVVAAMALPAIAGGAPMVNAAPGEHEIRYAIAFSYIAPASLCSGDPAGPLTHPTLRMTLAFCWGARDIASAQMSVPDAAGPSSPRFKRAADRLMATVMTPVRVSTGR